MKVTVLVLSLFMFGLHAFAQSPGLSNTNLNILTLGDSNGSFPHSWPHQLRQALPNAQVCNISRSGRTIGFVNNGDSTLNSLMVLETNMAFAAAQTGKLPYDYIVIDLGTNDAKAVFQPMQDQVASNMEKLIAGLQNAKYPVISQAEIVIVSPTPYGTKADSTEKYKHGSQRVLQMRKAFKQIADRRNCLFVDGQNIPGLDIETMSNDGLHLDATASQKLAQKVIEEIARNMKK